MGNIFVNHIPDKGLVYRLYNNFYNPIIKWSKNLVDISLKKIYKW